MRRGATYAAIGRNQEALADLTPATARRVDDDWRGQVADYVLGSDGAAEFVDRVGDLLEFLIPKFEGEGKSYLSIGIGCTGGHHRSVAIVEALAERLAANGIDASIQHRDLER